MDINISEIKNKLLAGYQFAIEQGGKLAHHSVRILMQGIEHIRQDARWGGVTFAFSNIVFMEVTDRVVGFLDQFFEPALGSALEEHDNLFFVKACAIVTTSISMIGGMNIVLYKTLKPSLSPMTTAAISTASVGIYIVLNMVATKRCKGEDK